MIHIRIISTITQRYKVTEWLRHTTEKMNLIFRSCGGHASQISATEHPTDPLNQKIKFKVKQKKEKMKRKEENGKSFSDTLKNK